jgi:D-tyrosyl-tRNA(Tyr) deacylase
MRAVVQRVRCARVTVDGEEVCAMGPGLLALVGVAREDTAAEARDLARRLVHLRVFEDGARRMNRSLLETGGTLGLVSQFTLYGDARRGRRPSFGAAAPAAQAEPLLEAGGETARSLGATVVSGRFRATMDVALVNAGPVTILLDSAGGF